MAGPFGTTELEIPPPSPSVERLTWTQNLLQSTLAQNFAMLEWPVPKGYCHPVDLRTFLNQSGYMPISVTPLYKVRRAERTTAPSATRSDIARAERTTAPTATRVDE